LTQTEAESKVALATREDGSVDIVKLRKLEKEVDVLKGLDHD